MKSQYAFRIHKFDGGDLGPVASPPDSVIPFRVGQKVFVRDHNFEITKTIIYDKNPCFRQELIAINGREELGQLYLNCWLKGSLVKMQARFALHLSKSDHDINIPKSIIIGDYIMLSNNYHECVGFDEPEVNGIPVVLLDLAHADFSKFPKYEADEHTRNRLS